MDEQLRIAALEYHRVPDRRQDFGHADEEPHQPARPGARVLARRRRRLRRDRRRPRRGAHADLARQPRRRRHQRHRRARPRQHRAAGRQAGDGRQGLPVQEVRRHRRLRHRARRDRPGRDGEDDRAARADVRRHQPRGHQGAGLLLHRAQAARADEDPGVPRRPARHRDRRRRGDPQRPQGRRQGHRQGEAGLLGRRRRGDRLPRPPRRAGPRARARHRLRQPGRDLHRPRHADGGEQGALRPRDERTARSPTRSPAPTCSSACRGRAR